MDRFNSTDGKGQGTPAYGQALVRWLWIHAAVVLFAFVLFFGKTAMAEERGSVAVLPFQVHAQKSLKI